MTDFLSAIQSGIQASMDKDRNIQEILDMIDQVKKSVETFTENKVTLTLRNSYIDMAVSLTVKARSFGLMSKDKPTSQVIEAILCDNQTKKEELTIVDFGVEGYPCTIYVDGNQLTALDKVGFEKNLARLLASPVTGSKLIKLVDISNKPLTQEDIERKAKFEELNKVSNLMK